MRILRINKSLIIKLYISFYNYETFINFYYSWCT